MFSFIVGFFFPTPHFFCGFSPFAFSFLFRRTPDENENLFCASFPPFRCCLSYFIGHFSGFCVDPHYLFFFTLPPSLVLKPHGPFLLLPTYPLNAAVKCIRLPFMIFRECLIFLYFLFQSTKLSSHVSTHSSFSSKLMFLTGARRGKRRKIEDSDDEADRVSSCPHVPAPRKLLRSGSSMPEPTKTELIVKPPIVDDLLNRFQENKVVIVRSPPMTGKVILGRKKNLDFF